MNCPDGKPHVWNPATNECINCKKIRVVPKYPAEYDKFDEYYDDWFPAYSSTTKCTCGAAALGYDSHSTWCDKK